MTVSELLKKGIELLKNNETENYSNEARWIFEAVFECGKEYAIFHSEDDVESKKAEKYFELINRRIKGEPVQYIIESWDFYGETFSVGKGVLIPRAETELLVDFAMNYLKKFDNPIVLDLCSGSGCIGLCVAKNIPDSTVYLVEKSDEAFDYLLKNKHSLGCKNAIAVKGDIFRGFENYEFPIPDLILSNPPYIEKDLIPLLQREVSFEPACALDGGEDGLDFYRVINDKWLGFCRGAVAVECGEGQAEDIIRLFSVQCASTEIITDFNGIKRTVIGYRSGKDAK